MKTAKPPFALCLTIPTQPRQGLLSHVKPGDAIEKSQRHYDSPGEQILEGGGSRGEDDASAFFVLVCISCP